MAQNRGAGDTRTYAIIAVFVIFVIILTVIFSETSFSHAYIDATILTDDWHENPAERDGASQWFGGWRSITYAFDGDYPANLTVTTYKTLVLMSEQELQQKTTEAIENAIQQGIVVDNDTAISGERLLQNDHMTSYVVYNGTDESKNPAEQIKIIGEVWNCGTARVSIVCIGIAQITDNGHNNSTVDTTSWYKNIRDTQGTFGNDVKGDDGLIYNVICH